MKRDEVTLVHSGNKRSNDSTFHNSLSAKALQSALLPPSSTGLRERIILVLLFFRPLQSPDDLPTSVL